MSRAAGAGDNHLEPALARALGIGDESLGRAMGRHDAPLMVNTELFQRLRCMAHGFPVRLAAHDDADRRLRVAHPLKVLRRESAHYMNGPGESKAAHAAYGRTTLPRPAISAILRASQFPAAEGVSMEIHDTKRVLGARRKPEARRAGDPVAVSPVTNPPDILSLAGIAEAELTPKLRQALMGLLSEVEQLKRDLGEARARIGFLERLADEDPLMPVANRRAFVRELTRMMSFTRRYGASASVVYFDINNLKQINDGYSHAAGDAALLQVAQILVHNVRDTDVVGRLGGDELGVLLVQTDQALAGQKAGQLAAAIAAEPLLWHGREIRLGVAFGVYSFSGAENAGDAIDAADRAMYAAKRHRTDSAGVG